MRAPKPRPREERTGREEAPSASRTRSPLPKAVADRRRWQGATTRNSWRYSEEEQRSQRRRDAREFGDGPRSGHWERDPRFASAAPRPIAVGAGARNSSKYRTGIPRRSVPRLLGARPRGSVWNLV